MVRTKIVVLGEKEYVLSQLPMRQNKEWREKLTEPVNKIISLVQNYRDIEINSAADIVGLITIVKDVLFGSMDLLLDSLFSYSQELEQDRERIEEESYDDEAITALVAIADLAYPFGRLVNAWIGPAAIQTSTNLGLQNGSSGTKKHLARQKTT